MSKTQQTMAVTEQEYNKIIEWVQKQVLPKTEEYADGGYGIEAAIPHHYIENFLKNHPYTSYKEQSKVGRKKPEVRSTEFKEFWDTFPATAKFEYKGRIFPSDRALRSNYHLAEAKYSKILAEGVSHKAILQAMRVDVELKKIESYKTGQNRLNFLSGIIPYLNGKKYEVYLGEPLPKEAMTTAEKVTDYTHNA